MTTEQLRSWLIEGREIEFVYNDVEYFIGNYEEGRAIFKGKAPITRYFLDINTFIDSALINEISIGNIVKLDRFKLVTVF